MNLNEYQAAAHRTANPTAERMTRLAVAGLGLAGEAGETADLLKKHIGHGHPLDVDKVKKELGDVLWYVAEVCSIVGLDLDDVASSNIVKLKARYPDGFSSERSINRIPEGG